MPTLAAYSLHQKVPAVIDDLRSVVCGGSATPSTQPPFCRPASREGTPCDPLHFHSRESLFGLSRERSGTER